MPDRMTPKQRSYCMSRVKSADTAPERLVRSGLHRLGYRFRKCVRGLPGTPDVVLPKYRTVVFVDGNFWHGYRMSRWRRKLKPYWRAKILANRKRDERVRRKLRRAGWRVIRIWEHAINRDLESVLRKVHASIRRPSRMGKKKGN